MRGRPLPVLAVIAALLAFVPADAAGCTKRHSVPIESGTSPSGVPWTVEGTIGNNGSCREWLFDIEFQLSGAATWGWGTGIPVGGHLSPNSTIDASDDLQEDGSERVLSGTVGSKVAKVVATLSNGKHLKVQLRSPSASLRRDVVWLRGFHYFVQYYPPEGFVTSIALFSSSGQLLHRTRGSGDSSF